jgi:spermidine/putrescine ABC transporter ATP-binding subunit
MPHNSTIGKDIVDSQPFIPAAREPTVALAGVKKRFGEGRLAAVAGIDLDVFAGEFFSILGPSGSGKTTTLRMIAGFERPTEGRVRLGGVDVTATPPYRRDVSTVFQNYALFPHMTVAQNVAYPLKMRKVARSEIRSRVTGELARVAMTGFESRLPHQLSGGQRQRVALARALISRPSVLLLDEPLGALDLQLRQQMQMVLKHLQRDVGSTFLYVTHDQSEALAMSDRLAVMHEGRVHQVGTPREVYFRPSSTFVAGFIGKSNILDCVFTSDGNNMRAQCGTLALEIAGHRDPGKGRLSIRPEAFVVGGPESTNRFRGVVREVIFLGDVQEAIVDVGQGLSLVVRIGSALDGGVTAGMNVILSLPIDGAVVLDD